LVANISKAQLTMSDGTLSKPLKWSVRKAAFVLASRDLPLLAGKTYSLNVKTVEGNTATASSKMPNEIVGALLTRTKGIAKNNQRKDRLTLELNAESGKTNYLEFRLFVKSTYTSFGNVSEQLRLINKSIIKEDALTAAIGVTYSDDVPVNTGSSSGPPNPNFSFVIVYQGLFIKANEEYYKYLDASKKNFDASGNPFAEPTSLYTNITGGLGVFAAYQLVIKEIPYD
jgi:hypothetical protein